MKKKLLPLVGAMMLALTIGACNTKSGSNTPSGGNTSEVVTKYTVVFYVDGERYATKKVNEGDHITGVTNPKKDGYKFVGWLEGDTLVDLSTYVVTKDTEFNASFELDEGDVLSVDDKKEAGKDYYLVFGWWEDSDSESGVSGLTKDGVRMFYDNVRRYLKAKTPAATDADLANIQFRNYSSVDVAALGEALRADADVDIVIGVGGNINEDPAVTGKAGANVPLYDNNKADYKFSTKMGTLDKSRTVACLQYASALGAETYEWLKTDTGKASFLRTLTDQEIAESVTPVETNLTVKVHSTGDTTVDTVLEDETTVIGLPTYTIDDDHSFLGYSLTKDGKVVLEAKPTEELTYDNIKNLVEEETKVLDLYPVIVHADLVVYIQVQAGYLERPEAELFKARMEAHFSNKDVVIKIREGDKNAFMKTLDTDGDVLVCGNNIMTALKEATPTDLYDIETYKIVNAGAKHFKSTNRKTAIKGTVKTGHLELADLAYKYIKADAEQFVVHAAYWPNAGAWVLDGGKATIDGGMRARLNAYLNTSDEADKTFENVYNVVLTTVEVEGSDVATLGASTRALRDNAGTDLIIGCGEDVATTGGMSVIAKKIVTNDGLASGRYVALIHENGLTRDIFNNYFVEAK